MEIRFLCEKAGVFDTKISYLDRTFEEPTGKGSFQRFVMKTRRMKKQHPNSKLCQYENKIVVSHLGMFLQLKK